MSYLPFILPVLGHFMVLFGKHLIISDFIETIHNTYKCLPCSKCSMCGISPNPHNHLRDVGIWGVVSFFKWGAWGWGRWNCFPRPRGKSTDLNFSSAVSHAPKHLSCPLQNVLRSTEGHDSGKSHLGRVYEPYSHPTVIKMNKK